MTDPHTNQAEGNAIGAQAPPASGQPGWAAPAQSSHGASGERARGRKNGLSAVALVVGVIALLTAWLFVGGVLGIAAIILAVIYLRRVRNGRVLDKGSAVAGTVFGVLSAIAAIVLGALSILLTGLLLIGAVSFFTSDRAQNFADCSERAAGDQTAEQACRTEFGPR